MRHTYTGTWTPIVVEFMQSERQAMAIYAQDKSGARTVFASMLSAIKRIPDPPTVIKDGLSVYLIKEK